MKYLQIIIFSGLLFLIGCISKKKTKFQEYEINGMFYKYLPYEFVIQKDLNNELIVNKKSNNQDTTYISSNPIRINLKEKFTSFSILDQNSELRINAKAKLPTISTFFYFKNEKYKSGDTIQVEDNSVPLNLAGEFINYDVGATFFAKSFRLTFIGESDTKTYNINSKSKDFKTKNLELFDIIIIDNICLNVFGEEVFVSPHVNYIK